MTREEMIKDILRYIFAPALDARAPYAKVMFAKAAEKISALSTKPTEPAAVVEASPDKGMALCSHCGTWRRQICGEGCTFGVERDTVNGGFRVSTTVLEWYYKDWRKLVARNQELEAALAAREATP